jgi:hypothetical protein
MSNSNYSDAEFNYCTKGLNSDELNNLNPLIFAQTLTKADRANMTDAELEIRKKMQAKRSRFRYLQNHPEKKASGLEKLKELKARTTELKKVTKVQVPPENSRGHGVPSRSDPAKVVPQEK